MSQLVLALGAPQRRHKPGWKSPEWRAWQDARRRCNNPRDKDYADYGGRGIRVCADWDKPGGFAAFFTHIGAKPDPRHTLDRINVQGNYEPGNVRWATWTEQANNRRSSKLITWRGRKLSAADWARETGIPRQQIANRINRGWAVADALTTPMGAGRPANDNAARRAPAATGGRP